MCVYMYAINQKKKKKKKKRKFALFGQKVESFVGRVDSGEAVLSDGEKK